VRCLLRGQGRLSDDVRVRSVLNNPQDRMSALGQEQTSKRVGVMSALPPKADIHCGCRNVSFGPQGDICSATIDRDLLGQVMVPRYDRARSGNMNLSKRRLNRQTFPCRLCCKHCGAPMITERRALYCCEDLASSFGIGPREILRPRFHCMICLTRGGTVSPNGFEAPRLAD
jgi:hypothetical protein